MIGIMKGWKEFDFLRKTWINKRLLPLYQNNDPLLWRLMTLKELDF